MAASDYDVAVRLAIDLRDLAAREPTATRFAQRFEALRKRQMRRRGFRPVEGFFAERSRDTQWVR